MRRSALQAVASLLGRAAAAAGRGAASGTGTLPASSAFTAAAAFEREASTLAGALRRAGLSRLLPPTTPPSRGARFLAFQPRAGLSRLYPPTTPPSRGARFLAFQPRGGPPRHRPWQARFDPAGFAVIWGLIAANGAVYLLWRIDPYTASKHFVVSLESVRDGRFWTPLTAAFSQQDTWHLASNLISLYFFGGDVGRIFGGRRLLALYLAGALAGSAAHLGYSLFKERQRGSGRVRWGLGAALQSSRGALGASAAVNAIMLVDILLFPTRTILLYGFIPMPAALLGALWLWNDLGGTLSGGAGPVAHAGHLGGAAAGLAFYTLFRAGRIRSSGWW